MFNFKHEQACGRSKERKQMKLRMGRFSSLKRRRHEALLRPVWDPHTWPRTVRVCLGPHSRACLGHRSLACLGPLKPSMLRLRVRGTDGRVAVQWEVPHGDASTVSGNARSQLRRSYAALRFHHRFMTRLIAKVASFNLRESRKYWACPEPFAQSICHVFIIFNSELIAHPSLRKKGFEAKLYQMMRD